MTENVLRFQSKQSPSIVGIVSSFLLLLLTVVLAVGGLTQKWPTPVLLFEYLSSIPETRVQVYFDLGEGLNERHNYAKIVQSSGDWHEVGLELPTTVIHGLRLDPAISPGTIGIRNLRIVDSTGAVRLQVPLSAIQSGNHILSRIENNGELEIQTTLDAYDPNLPILLEKQIDLRLSESQEASVDAKRILSRVLSVWWVIVLTGFLIFDLYYRPLFQRRVSLLYRIIRGDPDQKPKTTPIKKRPMDYLAGTVILLFLAYAAVLTPYVQQEPHIRSDGVGYHIWTHGIKSGDFSFVRYQSLLNSTGACSSYETMSYPNPIYSTDEWKLRCFLIHPVGIAMIRLPLMIWFVDPRKKASFSNAEHQVSQICAIIALMLIILCVATICRHHNIPSENIQLAILTVVFGTGLFHYATYDNSFSHVYSALGTALFSLVTFLRHGKYDSPRYLFMLLALSFLFILIRNINVFIIIFFWAYWVYQHGVKSNIIRILISGFGIFAAAAVQLGYNYYVTSELTISSYGDESFVWDRPMFWSVLFDFNKGLVIYYPIFVVILLAGFMCKKTRTLTLFYLSLILFFALLYGYWYMWDLSAGFGHRGFVDIAPLLIIILAMAFQGLRFHVRVILQGLCVLSMMISVQLMSGFWQATLPNRPNQEIYWSHLLGQEGTPFYWHSVLMFVCAVVLFRVFFLYRKIRKGRRLV